VIVGTAGHIDHGKTALVRALTGTDTDRLPEEKARGITIDLGFAYRPTPNGVLGFVDVPGHERFIHNMLAGATGIDFVVLAVAVDDGPMPQTREHLQILDLLGLDRGVVALTKIDLATPERVAEVADEMRALVAGTGLAGADIYPVSALTGQGVGALEARLISEAAGPGRAVRGRFRLAIDRVFTLAGIGTVATGTAVSGRVAVDDQLTISPAGAGISVRVRGIHAHNQASVQGVAGQRCALNIAGQGLTKDRVHRGDWLLDPALHAPTDRLDVRFRLLPSETKELRHWTPVHVHLGAAHMPGRVALLAPETLKPGASGLAQLVLDRPIGALAGDRFILRDQSAQRTIGGGTALDPSPPSRGRRRPERLHRLAAMDAKGPAAAFGGLLSTAPGWIDLDWFRRTFNLTDTEAADVFAHAEAKTSGAIGFERQRWTQLRQSILEALSGHHKANPQSPGLESDKLRLSLPERPPPAVFAELVRGLLSEDAIQPDGPWLRIPGHSVRLSPADEKLWGRVQPEMRRKKFEPPRVRDFANALGAEEDEVRQMLRRLAKLGRVVQVAPDHFFERPVVAEMARLALGLADKKPLAAADFRDRIGTGRKLAIQILEFFDRAGVTIRQGDLRRVNKDKVGRFDS
jgi:selenocysteine-specific elongation factor